MLGSRIGKEVLDGFCRNTLQREIGSEIDFNISNAYLGLLTALPGNDEAAYSEPEGGSYHRVRLNDQNPLEKQPYISTAECEEVEVDGTTVQSAYVTNPTYIMFPEALENWGTIVGFGIFSEASGPELPYIWGQISPLGDESGTVTINEGEVPIIRAGNFKVSLR
jgi:hypothetical protein